MRIIINVIFISVLLFATNVKSADLYLNKSNKDSLKNGVSYPKVSLGFGSGLDYAGFGVRITSLAYKNFSLSAGLGYNLSDVGVSIGAIVRILPNKVICPFVSCIYGVNAVIVNEGSSNNHQSYYGGSLGLGFELRSSKLRNYFSFGFYAPIRSQTFENDWSSLSRNPNVKITNEPEDVIVTIGYHMIL